MAEGTIASPEVAPGNSGTLKLDLPADWKSADALAVTARDQTGHELWTWVWPLQPPNQFVPTGSPVAAVTAGDELQLKAGDTEARIETATGQLLGVKVGRKRFFADERADFAGEVDDVGFRLAQAGLFR